LVLGVFGGHEGESGAGEDLEPEMAAAFYPFVVSLGQDGPDEADDRAAVGENAYYVGSAADLPVEPLVGVVGPDLPPDLLGERGEREDVSRASIRWSATLGSFSVRVSTMRSNWACTDLVSGWS
jgi:hypothetical protein